LLQNPGITNKELAKELGVNHQTIMGWRKTYEYQQYENWVLQRLPPETRSLIPQEKKDVLLKVRERFETYLDEMEDRLMTILQTTESEKLQVEIIHDVYDRVGFVSKKEQSRQQPLLITAEAMAEFMSRATEAGILREVAGSSTHHSTRSLVHVEAVEGEVLGHSGK
jgi:DNA-binding XRE family transcriptional regulator